MMLELLLAVEVGNWEKIDVWVAGIAASVLTVVLIVSSITAWAARQSAEASKTANERADTELDIRLRASIGIGVPDVWGIPISVPIRNYGETPANRMDLFSGIGEDLQSLWEEIDGFEIRRRNAIFPGEAYLLNIPTTGDNLTRLRGGTFYSAVRAYYGDYRNRDWVVESSYEHQGNSTVPVHVGVPNPVSDLPLDNPARIAYDAANIPPPSNTGDTNS